MEAEEAAVSPPLKTMKFEKLVDDVPRGGEGTEHLLKIPEGAVKKVLGGSDRGYDLPEGTNKELEMVGLRSGVERRSRKKC